MYPSKQIIDRSHYLPVKEEFLARLSAHFPFALNEQQQQVLEKMWAFLEDPQERFFLLAGYAGTGKSTIVFALVKELVALSKQVALCAPTNKAVAVLKSFAASHSLSAISCLTIHQLLGLGLVNRGSDKQLEQTGANTVSWYNVVFLDECSMVNRQLWEWLQESFAGRLFGKRTKLILMGDPAQLNPVAESRSPVFALKNRFVLTQVVRQLEDNPLLEFVTDCRQAVTSKRPFYPRTRYVEEDKSRGALRVKETALLRYALKKAQQFDSDPDGFRILCYTNRRVNYYNGAIRRHLYGENAPQFVPGERLMAKKPAIAPDGKSVVLSTSAEVQVEEVQEQTYWGYRACALVVRTDAGELRQLYTLHKSERERFEGELESKRLLAQKNPFLWHKYYQLRDDVFAQVDNCFALTVHNSQGSTFAQGAVDGKDLAKRLRVGSESARQRLKEYNRLWYVAASRFQQRLLFIGNSAK